MSPAPTPARPTLSVLLAGLVLAGAVATGRAADENQPLDGSVLVWSAGPIDVVDPLPRTFLSIEVRFRTERKVPSPWLAFETTARDQFYAFGMDGDLPLGRRWIFTPSVGAAIYQQHDGLSLGYPLEFRSMAEFTCRVGPRRIGVSFGHYSNLYLGETNRGTEFLKAVLVVPLGKAAVAPPD